MGKDSSSTGIGLGIFALIVLVASYIFLYYLSNPIFAALTGLLASIIGTASYLEARRTNGHKRFALIVLIIAIFGTFLIILRSGSIDASEKNRGFTDEQMDDTAVKQTNKRIDELEKKLENLEEEN
jgi:uncharacterized membrane protein